MPLKVIVLCAGIGERLRPLTYDTNKSLLEINGKPLIVHWLDALVDSGCNPDKVYIVIGHYGYKFRKLLGKEYRGMKIGYLVNPLYKITGAAQSLYIAFDILWRHECLVLEGDHYMTPELMHLLMSSEYENCCLVDSNLSRLDLDEEVVVYGRSEHIQRFKWMPPYPENIGNGEMIGEALTIFRLNKNASAMLALLLEQYLLEEGAAKREIVEPFNRLLDMHDMQYISTEGKKWVEIDFQSDLDKARKMKFEA